MAWIQKLLDRRRSSLGRRPGMTLVELLTVVAIISMLMAILMPALNSAREAGRQAACQNNLRQFGICMAASGESRNGALCTGAFDWLHDGCATEVGWVADMVNSGVPAGKMLCPSNPQQVAQTFNDLLHASPSSSDTCVDRLGSNRTTLPDGSTVANPCRMIIENSSGYGANSDARRDLVEQRIYAKHYNTNYTASWFLVRSEVVLNNSGNLVATPTGCPRSLTSRNSTRGPLKRVILDRGAVSSSFVPLLGCGAPAGNLAMAIGPHPAGSLVAKTMTDGPVVKETLARLPNFSSGTSRTGANGWWAGWNATIQDFRGFAPVHRSACNLLFGDGSVRAFVDANRDGLLNNGFPASADSGFASDTVEVSQEELFSKWSLREGMMYSN